nr:hypothetical protein [Tanacetum cinerariifolium]
MMLILRFVIWILGIVVVTGYRGIIGSKTMRLLISYSKNLRKKAYNEPEVTKSFYCHLIVEIAKLIIISSSDEDLLTDEEIIIPNAPVDQYIKKPIRRKVNLTNCILALRAPNALDVESSSTKRKKVAVADVIAAAAAVVMIGSGWSSRGDGGARRVIPATPVASPPRYPLSIPPSSSPPSSHLTNSPRAPPSTRLFQPLPIITTAAAATITSATTTSSHHTASHHHLLTSAVCHTTTFISSLSSPHHQPPPNTPTSSHRYHLYPATNRVRLVVHITIGCIWLFISPWGAFGFLSP